MHVFLASQQKVEPPSSTEPGLGRRRDVSQPEASSSSPLLPRRFCRCHYCRCYDLKIASNAKKKDWQLRMKKRKFFKSMIFIHLKVYAASIFANLDWLNYSLFFFFFLRSRVDTSLDDHETLPQPSTGWPFSWHWLYLNLRQRYTDYHTWGAFFFFNYGWIDFSPLNSSATKNSRRDSPHSPSLGKTMGLARRWLQLFLLPLFNIWVIFAGKFSRPFSSTFFHPPQNTHFPSKEEKITLLPLISTLTSRFELVESRVESAEPSREWKILIFPVKIPFAAPLPGTVPFSRVHFSNGCERDGSLRARGSRTGNFLVACDPRPAANKTRLKVYVCGADREYCVIWARFNASGIVENCDRRGGRDWWVFHELWIWTIRFSQFLFATWKKRETHGFLVKSNCRYKNHQACSLNKHFSGR